MLQDKDLIHPIDAQKLLDVIMSDSRPAFYQI